MFHHREHDLGVLGGQLRQASEINAAMMAEVIEAACQRSQWLGRTGKAARVEQLIRSGAWTDAALALIDLELPLWQVRRLAYDEGEWYCALSRERELPDWLDESIEARHADLALAILSAFVEARLASQPASRTSVPPVNRTALDLNEPICVDNFS
jgi:hypothetical protein